MSSSSATLAGISGGGKSAPGAASATGAGQAMSIFGSLVSPAAEGAVDPATAPTAELPPEVAPRLVKRIEPLKTGAAAPQDSAPDPSQLEVVASLIEIPLVPVDPAAPIAIGLSQNVDGAELAAATEADAAANHDGSPAPTLGRPPGIDAGAPVQAAAGSPNALNRASATAIEPTTQSEMAKPAVPADRTQPAQTATPEPKRPIAAAQAIAQGVADGAVEVTGEVTANPEKLSDPTLNAGEIRADGEHADAPPDQTASGYQAHRAGPDIAIAPGLAVNPAAGAPEPDVAPSTTSATDALGATTGQPAAEEAPRVDRPTPQRRGAAAANANANANANAAPTSQVETAQGDGIDPVLKPNGASAPGEAAATTDVELENHAMPKAATAQAERPAATETDTSSMGRIDSAMRAAADLTELRPDPTAQLATRRFATAMAQQPPAAQVAFSIAQNAGDMPSRIRMQLYPRELGAIEVRLDIQENHRAEVMVRAERPETIELLQRDARELQRALQAAGINVDSGDLSFELGGHSAGFHRDDHDAEARHAHVGDTDNDSQHRDAFAPPPVPRWRLATPGGVDMLA